MLLFASNLIDPAAAENNSPFMNNPVSLTLSRSIDPAPSNTVDDRLGAPGSSPIIVLFSPTSIERPAFLPIAMLLPLEFANLNASYPNAMLFEP